MIDLDEPQLTNENILHIAICLLLDELGTREITFSPDKISHRIRSAELEGFLLTVASSGITVKIASVEQLNALEESSQAQQH